MKTVLLTTLCFFFACMSFAQLKSKKILNKKISSEILAKPSNAKLKDVAPPKNFDINKISKLKVSQDKLKLPSRKKTRITPKRPYNSNLELTYQGRYNKNYFMLSDILGSIITYNAQRGKEYRLKLVLADKKYLVQEFNTDYSNGHVALKVGNRGDWYSIPVNQNKREINFVFKAVQAGRIQVILSGIYTPNWDWGDDLLLPIKSIQVDEI